MKRILFISLAVVAVLSCQKTPEHSGKGMGFLSFDHFSITLDEELITKSTTGVLIDDYTVIALDAEGNEAMRTTYSEIEDGASPIELLAGNYTLAVRSTEEDVPASAFEHPVYGVYKEFKIDAGATTTIGELECSLLQCKVTVSYSDEFLAAISGEGSTKVTVTKGAPLEYELSADGVFDQRAGYFAATGTTMEVVFSGKVNGKVQKMTKAFTGIGPQQWRKVHFVPKKNELGNSVFDIEINDLIDDKPLNVTTQPKEDIIGEDPDAPKGDGGIALVLDYEAGCDREITDLLDVRIVSLETRKMSINFRALVPSGVKKFAVDISTDNDAFAAAVAAAEATHLDLVNPLPANAIIFEVVPFPHGAELVGQTDIPFDLSKAQEAIINYKGRHTFMMTITDAEGCRNEIPVVMVVE